MATHGCARPRGRVCHVAVGARKTTAGQLQLSSNAAPRVGAAPSPLLHCRCFLQFSFMFSASVSCLLQGMFPPPPVYWHWTTASGLA
jgi:hypothetical protein